MNIKRLGPVLLCIFLQFKPGTPTEGYISGKYEYKQPWDPRYFLAKYSFDAPVSANCFGYINWTDPPWLGTKEFLRSDKPPNLVLAVNDYTYGLRQKDIVTTLTVSSINYKGKPLFGWFHLKLTTSNPDAVDFREVIAQVETEQDHWAQAGSFVRTNFNKASSCATKNANNKYDYKPCNYATDPFITAQQMFLRRANPAETVYEWNVKLEFPLCSIYYNDNALYFRIYILTDKPGPDAYETYLYNLPLQKWIYLAEHVYGAPDPQPPANAMADCTAEVGSSNITWITRRTELIQNVSHWEIPCNQLPMTYAPNLKDPMFSWGGRCGLGYNKLFSENKQYFEVSPNFRYNCHRQRGIKVQKFIFGNHANGYENVSWVYVNAPPENWQYPEINEYNKEALKTITDGCGSDACKEVIKDQTAYGVSASSDVGKYIYAGRQGHAILMIIACLFVYPLTNFVSRYFKGSFMRSRYIVNLHPWYAIHIYGTLTALTFLVTGLGMAIYARKYLGYSYRIAGRVHVSLGYISILLFLGGIVSNGLRYSRLASRNRSIILHASFGVLFYYLSLVTTAVAVWIPASPGNAKEKKQDSADSVRFAALVIVTLVFPIFEMVVHIIGTMQMRKRDKRFDISRDWAGFVAIPMVPADSNHDESDLELKSRLFVLYVVGTCIATAVSLITVIAADPGGRFFGPMTYTHVRDKLSTEYIEKHEEAEDVLL